MWRRAMGGAVVRHAVAAAALAILVACGGSSTLQQADVVPPTLDVRDSLLAERIVSLAERSPTWRAAMDTLRQNGFLAVIGTAEDIRVRIPELARYSAEHIGEVIPLRNRANRIIGAAVTVDVRRLEQLFEGTELPLEALHADVDRVLIHEVYGHLVPLSQAGTIEGGCPDPAPGEPALSSCAIQRENLIRSELGMELRRTYDILGLAIGRYYYGRRVEVW